MDRESSDEEEDDQETLINQHQTKLPQSTFHIDETRTRTTISRSSSNTSSNFNKSYLFAIILPLVFIILFFSLDTTSFFTGLKIDSSRNQMRESELQAFYLLKQQQSHLLNLWNRTLTHSRLHFGANSNNSSVMLSEDVRSVVLNLIRLNKEVQQALLSSHTLGNLSVSNSEFIGYNGCPRAAWVGERKTIEWNPKENKYLFAICVSGQMSNHLVCLEKHMFFAALLNRTLVIPSSKVDYWYHRVIDVDHINQCLGRKVVMSFEEFSEMKKQRMRIDRFICYVSLPQPCYVDGEHAKKIKSLGVSVPKLEPAWVEDVKNPKKTTVADVMKKFSCDDEVLGIGDVFFADVEKEWITQPGGPLSHQCKTLIEPSRLIRLTAQRFIQTFLGKNFVALHFRRHGFLKFCNAKTHSCFFPIPQAANCITRVAERANIPVIYLSTDAAESETDLLQSLTMLNGKIIPLVKRPARNFAEKWDALLYRHGLEGDSQVEAMLDKTICAMSSVFIGSSGSTFTEDIFRLRKDWQTASDCDEYLCQDERPNFIADSE